LNGSNCHYEENRTTQRLEWQDEKEELQFALIYTGNKGLAQDKFIEIAKSVKSKGSHF
jgi:hypothetical protein